MPLYFQSCHVSVLTGPEALLLLTGGRRAALAAWAGGRLIWTSCGITRGWNTLPCSSGLYSSAEGGRVVSSSTVVRVRATGGRAFGRAAGAGRWTTRLVPGV